MKEIDIEDECAATAAAHGWESYKLDKIPGKRGKTDRIFAHPKLPAFYVEFKRPKRSVTSPQQKREHRRLRERGFDVYVLDSFEEFDKVLRFRMGVAP